MSGMQILARELTRPDRPALERHFLALEAEDRRLRFGAPLNDFAVRTYVVRIDFDADAAFGVFDDDLHLVGAAHLGRGRGHAELGVSVLAENRAMMHLARKQAMVIAAAAGEADAWLGLPPADASSLFGAVFEQRVALFDYALKEGRTWLSPGR